MNSFVTRSYVASKEFLDGMNRSAASFDDNNSLVSCASLLLSFLAKLRHFEHVSSDQTNELRRIVIKELSNFSKQAMANNHSDNTILYSEYCLCVALDEAVLSTAWGMESGWSRQTLLSSLQKETRGGEKFFSILEELIKLPQENLPMLELLYIILSLGFEGKYYNQDKDKREEVKHGLFRLIRQYRKEYGKQILPYSNDKNDYLAVVKMHFTPWYVAALVFLALFVFGIIFNMFTYFSAKKILNNFFEISYFAQEKNESDDK